MTEQMTGAEVRPARDWLLRDRELLERGSDVLRALREAPAVRRVRTVEMGLPFEVREAETFGGVVALVSADSNRDGWAVVDVDRGTVAGPVVTWAIGGPEELGRLLEELRPAAGGADSVASFPRGPWEETPAGLELEAELERLEVLERVRGMLEELRAGEVGA
jgi:hypothetical protein